MSEPIQRKPQIMTAGQLGPEHVGAVISARVVPVTGHKLRGEFYSTLMAFAPMTTGTGSVTGVIVVLGDLSTRTLGTDTEIAVWCSRDPSADARVASLLEDLRRENAGRIALVQQHSEYVGRITTGCTAHLEAIARAAGHLDNGDPVAALATLRQAQQADRERKARPQSDG